MHGATHLAVGCGVGLFFVKPETAPLDVCIILGATAFGALLPDVDTPGSTLSRWIKPLKIFSILGHRGIFHYWVVPVILLLASWQVGQLPMAHALLAAFVLQLVFWGFLSHLFLDAFNPSGIPLFWPLPRAVRLAPLRFCPKSGSLADWAIMFLATFAFLYGLNAYYPTIWYSLKAFLPVMS